jgi:hypothetical protein
VLAHSVVFGVVYVLGTGALMYANTVWFGLGDIKFGTDGWKLYWPLWSVFYSPIALAAIVIAWRSGLPNPMRIALMWLFLLITLANLEASFVFDRGPVLLVQWVVSLAVFILVRSLLKYMHGSPTSKGSLNEH